MVFAGRSQGHIRLKLKLKLHWAFVLVWNQAWIASTIHGRGCGST